MSEVRPDDLTAELTLAMETLRRITPNDPEEQDRLGARLLIDPVETFDAAGVRLSESVRAWLRRRR